MINEPIDIHEELLLKSFDVAVSAREQEELSLRMQQQPELRRHRDQYVKIRQLLLRSEPDSFGPFFAERILNQLKQRVNEIDYLIFFFFKKYQVLVLGILVALLISNILLTDQLTIKSLFGIDQETTEDIFSINLYNNLIN
jgi:hypothetical protein